METTQCVFSGNKAECTGRKNSHIQHLMCDHHTREYFGLEITYSYIETPTETIYVGFNLKPVPGVFFRPNDVILPLRIFVDKTYRPKQVVPSETDRMYRMNPRLNQFAQRIFNGGRITPGDRYTYELIRNLSEGAVGINVNPTHQCEDAPQPLATIGSKYFISETFIKQNSNMNRINDVSLFVPTNEAQDATSNKDSEEREITHLNLSLSYKYVLSKMEFSSHQAERMKDANGKVTSQVEVQRMKPNAVFVKDVGLVAITDISDPDVIVIHGCTRNFTSGNLKGFYDEVCIVQPKEIVHPRPGTYRLGTQNATKRAMTSTCMNN